MSDNSEQWYCESIDSFRAVVTSQSDKTKRYVVLRDRESHKYIDERPVDWSCTCPAYEYQCGPHRKSRYCKHIEKVRNTVYCGWRASGRSTVEMDENHMAHCPECGRQAKTPS